MLEIVLRIETVEDARQIAYVLFDKAGEIEQTANRWGAKHGDGDPVDVALRADAAALTRAAKQINKQIKEQLNVHAATGPVG